MSTRRAGRNVLSLLFWTICALLLFGAVATLRAVLDGERELRASDVAFDGNDLHAAIQHARRAASAYAPGAPHVRHGYERLLAIARGAEATGQPELAVLAWQAQRAAVLETASLTRPFPERLEEANRNLARLEATKVGADNTRPERAKRLFRQAQEKSEEKLPWGSLLAAGLALAAFGLGWFARQGLRPDGKIAWLEGRWGLLLFAAGSGLWALAAFRG
jgi:hypothetical protein